MATSLLTATYMFRLVFLTFFGERRHAPAAAPARPRRHARAGAPADTAGARAHLHDAPAPMALALIVLAIGSVLAGYVGIPHALGGHNSLGEWLHPSFTATSQALAECNVPAVRAGRARRHDPGGMRAGRRRAGDGVHGRNRCRTGPAGVGLAAEPRQPAGAEAGQEAAAEGRRRDGARTEADGGVVGHRLPRHRAGRLPVAEEPAHPRLAGGAVLRPLPPAAQQVLRGRDLRRRHRPPDPAGLDRRAVEGDGRRAGGRRGQRRRPPGGGGQRRAAAAADRVGAQSTRLRPSSAWSWSSVTTSWR